MEDTLVYRYADGETINQLDACQLENNDIYHINVDSINKTSDVFIKQSPNPSAGEISYSVRFSTLRQLDKCFNNIETMYYCDDKTEDLCRVHTNKMKDQESKRGMKNSVKNIPDWWHKCCECGRDYIYI